MTVAEDTWLHTPGGHPVVMSSRPGTNDHNTLQATLNEDEYDLPRGLTGTVLDIGGYLGSVGIALALDNPGLRVIMVEPVPDNIRLIRENIAANGVESQVTLIEGAVGRDGQTVEVAYGFTGSPESEHHANVGNSSLFRDQPGLRWETVSYPALTLSDLLVMAETPVTFMKIDVEGGEYDFLDSKAIGAVRVIAGEWHNTFGHTREDFVDLLIATHDVKTFGPIEGPGGFRAERR